MGFLQLSGSSRPFWIGRANGEDFWTNIAVAHENGNLTNEYLLKQLNSTLKGLLKSDIGAVCEEYRRPNDKKLADKQGGYPDEVYIGAHRAQIILEYREAKKREQFKALNYEQQEAIESLVYSGNRGGIQSIKDILAGKKTELKSEETEPEWCEKHKCFLVDCDCFDNQMEDEVPF